MASSSTHGTTEASLDLSLVYINKGMGELLLNSLRSLVEAEVALDYEVLIVHVPGGPDPDDLRAQAKAIHPAIKWLEEPEFGVARLRNVGITAAQGRYVTMIDADTVVQKGCFEALVEFMDANPKAAGCGPRTLHPDGSGEPSAKRFYTKWTIPFRRPPLSLIWPSSPPNRWHLMLDEPKDVVLDIDWMAGACYMMRAEAISHIGDFDDSFRFGMEDVDWCYRAKIAGWRIYFVPHAEIVHDVQRSSARGLNWMTLAHLQSGLRFWRKHRRTPRPPAALGAVTE